MTNRILSALLLGGCVAGAPGTTPSDDERPLTDGGELFLEACSYTLITRVGASVPELGTPFLGEDPTPTYVHLGFAQDPSTSIAVQWQTPDHQTLASSIEYGVGAALDETAVGATWVYGAGFGNNSPLIRVHEVHLCGLAPDTEYSYRVGGDGAWSPTYTFRTAPLPSDDVEIVVASLGDTRDGYDVWASMLDLAMEIAPPDLILFNGDAVTVGQVQFEWDAFFGARTDILARIPIISAHGNHDVNSVNFFSLFTMPGDEENFSFDYGPAHVTVLNDSPIDETVLQGSTADFLNQDLTAAAGRPWLVTLHHKPLWSASANHGGEVALQDAWGPIFDAHEVDMVLSGHDHDYERTKPMRGANPQPTPAEGTVYVVAGSAGASLYDNGTDFWTELSAKAHSLVLLRIRRGRLELNAFREDGSMLDSLIITKELP